MSESILNSTKLKLGLAEEYDPFDNELIDHINGVFTTLHDLGVGPPLGFTITGPDDTWESYINGDVRLMDVPTYMGLRLRMIFDPPGTSFTQASYQRQIEQHEYRLMTRFETEYLPVVDDEIILEGGEPD